MLGSQTAIPPSPEERQCEVAAILVRGVLQYRRIATSREIKGTQVNDNCGQNSLDFLGKTRLSVSHGTRDLGLPDKERTHGS